VLFQERPLTEEEVDEYILIARSWVRQPVEADVVMAMSLPDMKDAFGPWWQGATEEDDAHTRWPVGGGDWRETLYGMCWIPPGVEFTTDLAEPARSEMRESLQRVLRALDAAAPPPRAA
jgi:hypothetical protein